MKTSTISLLWFCLAVWSCYKGNMTVMVGAIIMSELVTHRPKKGVKCGKPRKQV